LHALYLLSVWLHVFAAAIWVGGTFFLTLVVVPALRGAAPSARAGLLKEAGRRFRNVAWACFSIVLVTGSVNLWVRGVRLADFLRPEWLSSPFGKAVACKLCVFVLVLCVSAYHDFVAGPAATKALREARGTEAERLRARASWLGRGNATLALVLIALGVILVRGWP
jgi:putative copper resistance protein D